MMINRMLLVPVAGFLLATGAVVTAVQAQSLDITSGGDGGPIEILADDGIEWHQQSNVFIARENARAIRGTVTVESDLLRAHYRDGGGDTEIWRMDAQGSVKIKSPTETIYGDEAIYDIDNSVLVVRGEDIRFIAGEDTITADDQLEYWEIRQIAVARGDAVVSRVDKTLYGDVLVAHFRRDAADRTTVHRIDAYDDIRIVTADETITSDRGVYNVVSGIVTLTGTVVIVRGQNRLNGCKATVNLNTNVSRLFACEAGTGARVQGTFMPENSDAE